LVQNAQGIGEGAGHSMAWPETLQRRGRLIQRPAEPNDTNFLLALFAESRPELALLPEAIRAQLIHMQFDSQLSQYRSSAPEAVDWILELNLDGRAEPVGRCYLQQGPDEHRLLDLAILTQWRGHGLGSEVITLLCEGARQSGVPLRLSVWHANLGAIRLYRRLGFTTESAEFPTDSDASGYLRMRWLAEAAR
jgi:ribosomal protein S18 acetylase RimI-like enzyme